MPQLRHTKQKYYPVLQCTLSYRLLFQHNNKRINIYTKATPAALWTFSVIKKP